MRDHAHRFVLSDEGTEYGTNAAEHGIRKKTAHLLSVV